ncbi:MAG: hypothetical protein LH632_20530, partial [Rhodoferax sp.]|nr:hypothetical protein [Rhodoferax sp.]
MAVRQQFKAGEALATVALLAGICFFAILAAGVINLFPLMFSLGLVGVAGMLLLMVTAALMPSTADAPRSLLNRLLAVVLVVSAVWPGYIAYKYGAAPGVSPTRVVYWGLIVLWAFWFMASPVMRRHLFAQLAQAKLFHLVLGAYALWQFLASGFSITPFVSAYYLVKLLFGGYLFYLIVLSVVRDADDVERLIVWIALAAVAVSLIGVVENFRKANLFAGIFPSDPEQLETLEWIILDKSRSGAYRVASTFSHPLAFAEYLTMCLPLVAYLGFNGQTALRRWLGVCAIPLLLGAIYLTHTRSALITATIVVVTLTAIVGIRAAAQHRHFLKATLGAFTLVGVVVASIGGAGILTELTLGRDAAERGSTDARLVM